MKNIAVVIPAYNETLTILQVVTDALQLTPHVIVVNDASEDDTVKQVKSTDAILVDLPVNGGKAKALQVGFEKALTLNVEAVITLDGDAQHNPFDIPKLLAYFVQNPNDLCIASRLKDRQNAPRSRRIANGIADFWVSWAAGVPIADSQSGFRLYPATILKALDFPYHNKSGFVFESEVLVDIAHFGYGFAFIPIDTVYAEDRRESHFRAGFDITQITLMVARKLLKKGMNIPGLIKLIINQPNIIEEQKLLKTKTIIKDQNHY